MSVMTILLSFVVSTLGMGMIYVSQLYLKSQSYRKHSVFVGYASENGIKRNLHEILETASGPGAFKILSEDQVEAFRANAETGGLALAENILAISFPRIVQETWERVGWKSSLSCALLKFENKAAYFRAEYGLHDESEGSISGFKAKRLSKLEATMGIFCGNVPLPSFPLLINKTMTAKERDSFIRDNGISLVTAKADPISAVPRICEAPLIPEDASQQLGKALKIKLFQPQDLTPSKLRFALGLPAGNEPVPDGVYLIKDDLGLGGIYVQGDLDEMIAAIEQDSQILCFRMEAGEWILKFSPARSKTDFITPSEVFSYDLIPNGIIIVSGKIASLGGGVVDFSGKIVMARDKEIPSILNGVNLTIISSEKIVLSSHLILQGVEWRDGIPYLKDTTAQVVIFSTGKDFISGTQNDAGITVAGDSPQNIKIQASLTTKSGFTVEGSGKNIELLGGIQAEDFDSNGNNLTLAPDQRFQDGRASADDAPLSVKPLANVVFLRILEWREY